MTVSRQSQSRNIQFQINALSSCDQDWSWSWDQIKAINFFTSLHSPKSKNVHTLHYTHREGDIEEKEDMIIAAKWTVE